MKIAGGSFGPTGKVAIGFNGKLVIKGAKRAEYAATDISSFNTSTSTAKSFGYLSFIVGAIVLGFIGLLLLGILGAVIGLVISVAGSFYSTSSSQADLEFADGKSLSVTGTGSEITRLAKFAP